jgi:hypothetical protein
VECADQILAGCRVDPGLAADRAVDLREEGGGDLDVAAAPLQDCRGEAGQVAHHAAAKGDEMVLAPEFEGEQPIGKRGGARPALGALALAGSRAAPPRCRSGPALR